MICSLFSIADEINQQLNASKVSISGIQVEMQRLHLSEEMQDIAKATLLKVNTRV